MSVPQTLRYLCMHCCSWGGSGHGILSTMTTPGNVEGDAGKALGSHGSLNGSIRRDSSGESKFTTRASLRRDSSLLRNAHLPIEQVEECAAASCFLDSSTSLATWGPTWLPLSFRVLCLKSCECTNHPSSRLCMSIHKSERLPPSGCIGCTRCLRRDELV